MSEETLTRNQALELGYTSCGIRDDGFQSLISIEGMNESDFLIHEYHLADKEGISPSIDNDFLHDIIADRVVDQWVDDTGDDTDEVADIINKIDFSDVCERVNKALSERVVHMLIDIKLIP